MSGQSPADNSGSLRIRELRVLNLRASASLRENILSLAEPRRRRETGNRIPGTENTEAELTLFWKELNISAFKIKERGMERKPSHKTKLGKAVANARLVLFPLLRILRVKFCLRLRLNPRISFMVSEQQTCPICFSDMDATAQIGKWGHIRRREKRECAEGEFL